MKHKKLLIVLICIFIFGLIIFFLKSGNPSFVPTDRDDFEKYKNYINQHSILEIMKDSFSYDQNEINQMNNFYNSLTEEENDELEYIFDRKIAHAYANFDTIFSNIVFLLPLIFLGITILLWYLFGKDKKIIESVEFYPPQNMSSLEAGFLYKGYVTDADISSLLVYLSNKGYLTVQKINYPDINEFGFKIIKLKEYDGNNSIEKDFLTLLFQTENGNPTNEVIIEKNALKTTDNEGNHVITSFTTRFYPLIRRINNKKNKDKIFCKEKKLNMTLVKIFIVISLFCITVTPANIYGGENAGGIVFFLIFGYALITLIVSSRENNAVFYGLSQRPVMPNLKSKIFLSLFIGSFTIAPTLYVLYPAFVAEPKYIFSFFMGFACVILMTFLHNIMPKRTDENLEILSKLNGFKHFLELAEKEKIEILTNENPNYFYDTFPYAFVLEVTNLWNGKYSEIVSKLPIEFTTEPYSIVDLGAFMAIINEESRWQNVKKILKTALFLILILININNVQAQTNEPYDYVIDNYDVNMVVNEDNTFNIIETITANFNVPKHGIFRKIPLKNKIVRLDGTTSTNRAKITNLSVDNIYDVSKTDGFYNIQIGSADETITGRNIYTIKYTYNIGKDPIKNYDEFYYNIIGDEWDTIIRNVTFSITMPKEFDSSKLGFSSGTKGSVNNENIIYNVYENTIIGSYNNILTKGEALTVRLELPEGYFAKATNNYTLQDYLIFIVPILGVIISLILWIIYGRDDKVIETVEFYPPEGFNSLEIGFLYKGTAYNTDVTSLLIYLANKGYIKITETNEKSLFSKEESYKITKLKEYDGNNINERLFLEGLFKRATNKDEHTGNLEVNMSELHNIFYLTVNQILANINNKENKQKIFEKKASSKKKYVVILMLISFILITVIPIINYGNLETIMFALIFPGVGFTVLFGFLFSKTNLSQKIFGVIWGLLFGGIPWVGIIFPTISQDNIYLTGYLFGFICLIIMALCFKNLSKRTAYGLELLGKIKGFKTYLETVEKDKLENMVMQNPNYFYDILPYTYVLGVSDKWIKDFETITIQSPNWYDSSRPFSVATYGTLINNVVSSANSTMSSSPSSSGSSGGGSSGGGSGGGGGGSW